MEYLYRIQQKGRDRIRVDPLTRTPLMRGLADTRTISQLEAEGYPWIGCVCCKGTVWVPFKMISREAADVERHDARRAGREDTLREMRQPTPPLRWRRHANGPSDTVFHSALRSRCSWMWQTLGIARQVARHFFNEFMRA
jgi:hypothetical protein